MVNELKIKSPLKRETYSQIIFVVKKGKHNLRQIENKLIKKEIKRSIGTLSPQINKLADLGYLNRIVPSKEDRTTSEKFYEVDWKRMALEFINFLQRTSEKKTLKKFKYVCEQKWTLKNNLYLQNLLRFLIRDHSKYFKEHPNDPKTIESLFEYLRIQMMFDKTYKEDFFKNLEDKDKEFAELIELTHEVTKAFSPNLRASLRKYLNSLKRTSKKNN